MIVSVVLTVGAILMVARSQAAPVDISGTWQFSVDLATGDHGDPTFVLKQEGETLTGSYKGPLGEHKVKGTVQDKSVVLGFEFEQQGQSLQATYKGTIESATKMSGTVEFTGGSTGKWTAVKK
jgi:hypothetical protein